MTKILFSILFIIVQLAIFAQVNVSETPAANTAGTLTVSATTRTAGGQYNPANCIAVWVQNSSNQWVKTLLLSAQLRRPDLTVWRAITSNSNNVVDAISGATRTIYSPINCTWNGTNAATPRVVVPDGVYTVKLELTDEQPSNYPLGHKVITYTFTKGPENSIATIVGSSENCFLNVSIQWVPGFTALKNTELEKQYSVYPNPTKSTAYIIGFDIEKIELCSLTGKSIFYTREQKINLSALPKGIYYARIFTPKGIIMKKIQKN